MGVIHSYAYYCGQLTIFNRSKESGRRRSERCIIEKLHHVLHIIIMSNHIYMVLCSVIFNMGLDNFIHSLSFFLIFQFYGPETDVLLQVSIHNLLDLFGYIDICFMLMYMSSMIENYW